jgi:hypothetical protein
MDLIKKDLIKKEAKKNKTKKLKYERINLNELVQFSMLFRIDSFRKLRFSFFFFFSPQVNKKIKFKNQYNKFSELIS